MENLKAWIIEKRKDLDGNKSYAQKQNDKILLQIVQGKIDILNEFEQQISNLEKKGE